MQETQEKTIDKRLANLRPKPWKPGESGNPAGRPKKEFSLTEGMREYISEQDPDKKKERKDILIEKTYQMAMRGDLSAIKEIWNRLEGMPQGSAPQVAVQINNNHVIHSRDEVIQEIKEVMKEYEIGSEELEQLKGEAK